MKQVNFLMAISIIAESHSVNIIINKVEDQQVRTGEDNSTIHIVHCVPAVIDKLHTAGFSLSMQNGFLSVDDYTIREHIPQKPK